MTESKTIDTSLHDNFFKDYSNLRKEANKKSLKKDENNPFFNSTYVKLPTVIKAATEICLANNFVFYYEPSILSDGTDALKTTLLHKDGYRLVSTIKLTRKDVSDPQKLGGAITYTKRYSIVALLGLSEEDDDGNVASGKTKRVPSGKVSVKPSVEEDF